MEEEKGKGTRTYERVQTKPKMEIFWGLIYVVTIRNRGVDSIRSAFLTRAVPVVYSQCSF